MEVPREFEDWVNGMSWINAKSYAHKAPHEYLVRGKLFDEDKDMFVKFALYIREHGYKKKFWNKEFMYFDIGEHQYWTMGNPIDETIILNRAIKKND